MSCKSRPCVKEVHGPMKQTGMYALKNIILFSKKKQGAFIRAGAFIKIDMVSLVFPRPNLLNERQTIAPLLRKVTTSNMTT